jgi:hypothetical protein
MLSLDPDLRSDVSFKPLQHVLPHSQSGHSKHSSRLMKFGDVRVGQGISMGSIRKWCTDNFTIWWICAVRVAREMPKVTSPPSLCWFWGSWNLETLLMERAEKLMGTGEPQEETEGDRGTSGGSIRKWFIECFYKWYDFYVVHCVVWEISEVTSQAFPQAPTLQHALLLSRDHQTLIFFWFWGSWGRYTSP